MKINNLNIFLIILVLCIGSCTSDGIEENKTSKGYIVSAEILGFETPLTRITRNSEDDRWTFKSFDTNDAIGFYSKFGNPASPDGTFLNEPMYYSQGNFYNYDIEFNADESFAKGQVFYYYPYHENIDYDENITVYNENADYGLNLRIKDENDGIEKCLDLLFVFQPQGTKALKFTHAFSSIVFLRGDGFRDAKNREIKVVLNNGYSHVTIADNFTSHADYYKLAKLVYLNGYSSETVDSEENAKIWYAWEGDDYKVLKEGDTYYGDTFEKAYYIILPTMDSSYRVGVDYIQLYDDNDELQTISNFVLYSTTKNMDPGQRYPLLIKMQNHEPVIYPIGIEPWKDDFVVDDERVVGIGDAIEFSQWAMTYSSYLNNPNPANETIEKLREYGDQTIETDGTVKWTFYLNDDIDFESYINDHPVIQNILSELNDCLDGNNHTITGLSISSNASPSFIGKLGENGIIQNLTIEGMTMEYTGTNDVAVGGLLNYCNGTVSNCDINGVITSKGDVGMIAATVGNNAVVKNCNLTGLLIGKSCYDKVIGIESNYTNVNNNVKGLFVNNN